MSFLGIALAGLVVFTVAALIVAAWLVGPSLWVEQRRARLRRRPFPAAWRAVLRRRMPMFARLPPDLQQRLRGHIQVFVAETPFIGCAGVEVSDAMRVLVAAQAGLLLLGRPRGAFSNLREVLMYPGAFVVERAESDPAGLVREGRR
ncbi:MAG: zinc-dependent peptidase, partial [Burkholderiales bacterium]|nr:zinc-dependent peptidase [Burkholderiales bacterium]